MGYYVILLLVLVLIELLVLYTIQRDVLDPAFVLCAVFCIATLNLLTNIGTIGITIHLETVLIVSGGIFFFAIGCFLGTNKKIKILHKKINVFSKNRKINLPENKKIGMLVFNCFSIIYILIDVYVLAQIYGGYTGNLWGALGRFAEVSKFSGIGLKVGTISTLLTGLVEAEGYILGYIIAKLIVNGKKPGVLTWLCLITAFLSTFCQGSRGGLFMIPAFLIMYIILYQKKNGIKYLKLKIIIKMVGIVFLALVVFQISANIMGKNWNVSAYEYLSVYLGFPIYNFDVAINNSIPRADIVGQVSFKGLLTKLYAIVGKELPNYNGYGNFIFLEGHNMGNVYTIFASLIADFGIMGMFIVLFLMGAGMSLFNTKARKGEKGISCTCIVYSYFLSCLAFSFFSNKVCENINVYHFFVFFFIYCWSIFLTKKET